MSDATRLAYEGFLTSYDLLDIVVNPRLAYTFPDGTTTLPDTSPPPSAYPF